MKIHHLRNATLIIESGNHFILVDPMLGEKGTNGPLAFIRHKARRNPLVSLPENSNELLEKVTHCLITHCQRKHFDHLDVEGVLFLVKNKIPVTCNSKDASYLKKRNINVQNILYPWKSDSFLEGNITTIPAKHGYGWIHRLMANGVGFFIELPNSPTIYISGDTVYTNDVDKALSKFKPTISIIASGAASLDIGKPILMTLKDIVKFIQNSPGKVIANHLEALNHCPTTREGLKEELKKQNLLSKVFIPYDGETLQF